VLATTTAYLDLSIGRYGWKMHDARFKSLAGDAEVVETRKFEFPSCPPLRRDSSGR
jgi:hypothetical protein